MSPDTLAHFRKGTLLRQTMEMSADYITITETRRDKDTRLVVKATFYAEALLTPTKGIAR